MIKNLKELKEKAKENKIKYAFGVFADATEPPHLVANIIDTKTKSADNRVFITKKKILIELTTINKDIKIEKIVENNILDDMYYEKSESYIPSERCYNVAYIIEFDYE